MKTLGEFTEETDQIAKEKEELQHKEETLDDHIHRIIEEKDSYIMEKLNTLQGDAAEKVKNALDGHTSRKMDVLRETRIKTEETEEMLSARLKTLDDQIAERNDALSKVEELGKQAKIDVTDSITDIRKEIDEMNEAREKVVGALRSRAKVSGRPIVI
ncbi:MAG: hypothetical protein A4E65_01576 [Syntrophorhabdus sp. PtaU1.Bin153]|nr:MAG: hypothetical protein A4E65_01576 [Syntrophorhabdus sp. PtaU1.Bin153]